MKYRINTRCLKNVVQINSSGYCSLAKLINMTIDKTVGVFIITAKHNMVRIFIQKIDKCVKIFGGTSFANNNLHSIFQLIKRFVPREAFMVGTYCNTSLSIPTFYIFSCVFAPQAWRMSIHWLIVL